ncbi:MAG TPA: MBL fold metallo-hydrolase [Candidatus Limnocylindria bacterium]
MTDELVERTIAPARDPGHGVRMELGVFGPWQTNTYLVWDGRSTDALVLDPGMGAAEPIVARAEANGLRVHLIANSHGHIDHIFDNAPLMDATEAPLAIHPDDAYRLDGRNSYGFELRSVTATVDLREGEQVRVGDLVLDVLHTPGHTEGSVCLYEERLGLLLSGDTLFAGAFGRVDFPGGDEGQMIASLGRLAREIPAGVRVLPGHGAETTIGREVPWIERVVATGRLAVG